MSFPAEIHLSLPPELSLGCGFTSGDTRPTHPTYLFFANSLCRFSQAFVRCLALVFDVLPAFLGHVLRFALSLSKRLWTLRIWCLRFLRRLYILALLGVTYFYIFTSAQRSVGSAAGCFCRILLQSWGVVFSLSSCFLSIWPSWLSGPPGLPGPLALLAPLLFGPPGPLVLWLSGPLAFWFRPSGLQVWKSYTTLSV